ncbi:BON domain-containing protein [Chitinolyticbacter albus]|uniref:BON domain-containing protein n=1 Tax=Chitinolyticbacter albus TaxID=2961951 RepID=UPI00210915DF|nr:BON domain-containing protein [Chitinolyticbacter albus]
MQATRTLALIATPLLLAGMLTACGREDAPAANDSTLSGTEASTPGNLAEASTMAHDAMDSAASATASGTRAVADAVDNAGLTTKVKAALADQVSLKTLAIDVDSDNGAVTLTGDVESEAQRTQAETAVRTVEGVTSVNNRLTVKKS